MKSALVSVLIVVGTYLGKLVGNMDEAESTRLEAEKATLISQGAASEDTSLEQVRAILEERKKAALDRERQEIESEERRRLIALTTLHDTAIENIQSELFHREVLLAGFATRSSEEARVASRGIKSYLAGSAKR